MVRVAGYPPHCRGGEWLAFDELEALAVVAPLYPHLVRVRARAWVRVRRTLTIALALILTLALTTHVREALGDVLELLDLEDDLVEEMLQGRGRGRGRGRGPRLQP